MKKLLLLFVGALAMLSSCHTPTIEEKAKALIEADMKTRLVKPDSYMLSNLTVDSCFTDQPTNYEVVSIGLELSKKYAGYKEYKEQADRAEVEASIFDSPYSRVQHKQAIEKFQKAKAVSDDLKAQILQIFKNNKEVITNLASGVHEFTGMYFAVLDYKAETNGGDVAGSEVLYYLNKDLTEIVASFTSQEFNLYKIDALRDIQYEFAEDFKNLFAE